MIRLCIAVAAAVLALQSFGSVSFAADDATWALLKKQLARFEARGEPGAGKIMSNIFDPDFIMENELVFIGSPETVAGKLRAAAEAGVFNTFMCEFNFSDLPKADLMRSIRLFGEQVIPALRSYEPF